MKGLIWQDDENIIDVVYQTIYGLPIKEAIHIVKLYQEKQLIPVEWLLKRAKLCTADYANCLHYAVEAWQAEQKYMVNGRWKFPKDGEKENEGKTN